MRWNWQQPNWSNFAYDAKRLRSPEDRFLKGAGILAGVMALQSQALPYKPI